MQLKASIILALIISFFNSFAQEEKLKDIEIDILSSYYEQDGNHSPVTGGKGTEELNNIAPSITINIPVDTLRTLNLSGGVDVYSSASSDNINNPLLNPNHVSSASAMDARAYGTIGWKVKAPNKRSERSYSIGISNEYDVTSGNLGYGYTFISEDKNRELNLKGKYFLDYWKLIYPTELRTGTQHLNTNIRHSLTTSLTGSAFLTKRISGSITSDLTYQRGLLSTPFHRVYFKNSNAAVVEQLPNSRIKIPVGLRLNWSIGDYLIWRNHYRYYWDNWDIQAHTIQSEVTIKMGSQFRLSPFYRFHSQSKAKYFGGYQTLDPGSEFFTSDYDLSALSSMKYGIGLSISPHFGLARWKDPLRKNKSGMIKSLDLRYAHYQRSDGFHANVISLGIKIVIDNGGWGLSNWKF